MLDDVRKIAVDSQTKVLKKLETNSDFQEYMRLSQIIAICDGALPQGEARVEIPLVAPQALRKPRDSQLLQLSKKEQIRKLAKECVIANNGYAHKNIIHQYLVDNGVEIAASGVSPYLSEFEEFEPDRVKGWHIIENNGTPAGESSSPQRNTADADTSAVGNAANHFHPQTH